MMSKVTLLDVAEAAGVSIGPATKSMRAATGR
ncbi:hypothetical protein SDC9_90990 [bioreactor metagenome]|uniref:Uncharacterized protein n=1 Tax=bioreactor metagenome TaxID=1076179 RepID=A0A644ZTX9_9ZZZZ